MHLEVKAILSKKRERKNPEAYNAACAARMKKPRDNKAAAAACVTPKHFHFQVSERRKDNEKAGKLLYPKIMPSVTIF